jgi:hypothetical protein
MAVAAIRKSKSLLATIIQKPTLGNIRHDEAAGIGLTEAGGDADSDSTFARESRLGAGFRRQSPHWSPAPLPAAARP